MKHIVGIEEMFIDRTSSSWKSQQAGNGDRDTSHTRVLVVGRRVERGRVTLQASLNCETVAGLAHNFAISGDIWITCGINSVTAGLRFDICNVSLYSVIWWGLCLRQPYFSLWTHGQILFKTFSHQRERKL